MTPDTLEDLEDLEGNSMVMALHAHALLAILQPPVQRTANREQTKVSVSSVAET